MFLGFKENLILSEKAIFQKQVSKFIGLTAGIRSPKDLSINYCQDLMKSGIVENFSSGDSKIL